MSVFVEKARTVLFEQMRTCCYNYIAGSDRDPPITTFCKTECDMKGMTEFMKITAKTDFLQETANRYGVECETVRHGIREAAAEARLSEREEARAFWETVPEDASEDEIVMRIVKLLFAE